MTSYPSTPGYKREGTSHAAADQIAGRAPTLRDQVLKLLQAAPYTADQCAMLLDKSVLSIRPRLSELVTMGLIHDTGATRRNTSGVHATVWKAGSPP